MEPGACGAGATDALKSGVWKGVDEEEEALGMSPKTWSMVNLGLRVGAAPRDRKPEDSIASSAPLGPEEGWRTTGNRHGRRLVLVRLGDG